jgi:hydroxymethylpyrimidine pyrophosphatase-like HAD family hydrolase
MRKCCRWRAKAALWNAHQRLKDLHPELEVIGSNADDAVPHYLRKLYLD